MKGSFLQEAQKHTHATPRSLSSVVDSECCAKTVDICRRSEGNDSEWCLLQVHEFSMILHSSIRSFLSYHGSTRKWAQSRALPISIRTCDHSTTAIYTITAHTVHTTDVFRQTQAISCCKLKRCYKSPFSADPKTMCTTVLR